MTIETDTVILPACWASALINGDVSGFSLDDDGGTAEIAAMQQELDRLTEEGWSVVDVNRDHDGEPSEPWFTWSYSMYGGTAKGGDVCEYTVLRDKRA